MTTTDRRIKRMYPALSPSERVLLALEHQGSGIDDAFVLATTPADQLSDVDRLLQDVGIANHELRAVILSLYDATRREEWRWRWFEAVAAHASDLDAVHQFHKIRGRSGLRVRRPIDLDAPGGETYAGRVPGFLKGFRDALVELTGQAYATEQILEEFSGELGGDALRPDARALLETMQQKLDVLFEQLESWIGPVGRTEDLSEELDLLRTIVQSVRNR